MIEKYGMCPSPVPGIHFANHEDPMEFIEINVIGHAEMSKGMRENTELWPNR